MEVKTRQIAEDLAREERKKAAEERRAAVVERLRIQQEKEEKRRQDEINEAQRQLNRLETDRSLIVIEDELSHLVEMDYRELLERKMWQKREAERLAEYERQQRLNDEIEDRLRKERMKDLEAKRAKLAEIRRLQAANSEAAANGNNSNIATVREEANKLNRQLNIQNKAKFVTKRKVVPAVEIAAPEVSEQDCEAAVPMNIQDLMTPNDTASALPALKNTKEGGGISASIDMALLTDAPLQITEELASFQTMLLTIDNEPSVRTMLIQVSIMCILKSYIYHSSLANEQFLSMCRSSWTPNAICELNYEASCKPMLAIMIRRQQ